MWRTAQLARDDFGTLICVGVLAMLLFQIFENVGMTMGIMPITGIPLPFVSYGGSSTLASFVAIGLVLNVHTRRFSLTRAAPTSAPIGSSRQVRGARTAYDAEARDMSSIWPQLEPLLPRVQKPARYIGCEDGARRPEHAPAPGGVAALPTPTPTRSGCRTRASRSSTRSSTSATTPSPSAPTRPGPTSRRCCARDGLPLFSVDTHRPAPEFDVLAFNLSAELVYTNVLNCIDLAGVPVRSADRRPEHRSSSPAGTAPSTPSRLADFVDFFVLGDGEEVVGEITDVLGGWKRPASRRLAPAGAPRPGRGSPASTCRRCTTCAYDGRRPRRR